MVISNPTTDKSADMADLLPGRVAPRPKANRLSRYFDDSKTTTGKNRLREQAPVEQIGTPIPLSPKDKANKKKFDVQQRSQNLKELKDEKYKELKKKILRHPNDKLKAVQAKVVETLNSATSADPMELLDDVSEKITQLSMAMDLRLFKGAAGSAGILHALRDEGLPSKRGVLGDPQVLYDGYFLSVFYVIGRMFGDYKTESGEVVNLNKELEKRGIDIKLAYRKVQKDLARQSLKAVNKYMAEIEASSYTRKEEPVCTGFDKSSMFALLSLERFGANIKVERGAFGSPVACGTKGFKKKMRAAFAAKGWGSKTDPIDGRFVFDFDMDRARFMKVLREVETSFAVRHGSLNVHLKPGGGFDFNFNYGFEPDFLTDIISSWRLLEMRISQLEDEKPKAKTEAKLEEVDDELLDLYLKKYEFTSFITRVSKRDYDVFEAYNKLQTDYGLEEVIFIGEEIVHGKGVCKVLDANSDPTKPKEKRTLKNFAEIIGFDPKLYFSKESAWMQDVLRTNAQIRFDAIQTVLGRRAEARRREYASMRDSEQYLSRVYEHLCVFYRSEGRDACLRARKQVLAEQLELLGPSDRFYFLGGLIGFRALEAEGGLVEGYIPEDAYETFAETTRETLEEVGRSNTNFPIVATNLALMLEGARLKGDQHFVAAMHDLIGILNADPTRDELYTFLSENSGIVSFMKHYARTRSDNLALADTMASLLYMVAKNFRPTDKARELLGFQKTVVDLFLNPIFFENLDQGFHPVLCAEMSKVIRTYKEGLETFIRKKLKQLEDNKYDKELVRQLTVLIYVYYSLSKKVQAFQEKTKLGLSVSFSTESLTKEALDLAPGIIHGVDISKADPVWGFDLRDMFFYDYVFFASRANAAEMPKQRMVFAKEDRSTYLVRLLERSRDLSRELEVSACSFNSFAKELESFIYALMTASSGGLRLVDLRGLNSQNLKKLFRCEAHRNPAFAALLESLVRESGSLVGFVEQFVPGLSQVGLTSQVNLGAKIKEVMAESSNSRGFNKPILLHDGMSDEALDRLYDYYRTTRALSQVFGSLETLEKTAGTSLKPALRQAMSFKDKVLVLDDSDNAFAYKDETGVPQGLAGANRIRRLGLARRNALREKIAQSHSRLSNSRVFRASPEALRPLSPAHLAMKENNPIVRDLIDQITSRHFNPSLN